MTAIQRRGLFLLLVCLVLPLCPPGQAPPPEKLESKAFEAAVSLAQSLTQWAFLIMGGSVVILVGTSYYRPIDQLVRLSYLSFIPGWICLGLSIYNGTKVQRAYLGYLFLPNLDLARLRLMINRDAYRQIQYMEWGTGIFGIWLLVYLIWWIFGKNTQSSKVG